MAMKFSRGDRVNLEGSDEVYTVEAVYVEQVDIRIPGMGRAYGRRVDPDRLTHAETDSPRPIWILTDEASQAMGDHAAPLDLTGTVVFGQGRTRVNSQMNRAERRGNVIHPHMRRGQRDNVRNGGEAQ